MQISPLLAGGLLLALLSVRLEAKPAAQLPQKVRRAASRRGSRGAAAAAAAGSPEAAGAERDKEKEKEKGRGGGGQAPREARAEARPRAGWARLLQDPPARRHKGLHKKGLGKGCFGLKLDRIGAMSGLGC
ncbi:C-type natriuretic peptide [Rhea pennata]|uniref:C-type natriuretic peptide n=1 Tax=Rhea pennata TaxID=8795 RepID=UPI002E270C1B